MYIYKTTNLINNKIYIGLSTRSPEESTKYIGSGTYLKQAIAKYGKENFRKDILAHCSDIESLRNMEIHYIKEHNSQDPTIGYNLIAGGGGFLKPTDELRERFSKSAKARGYKQSTIDALVAANTGREFSEETRQKLSKASTGRKHSEETKQQISEKLKGGKFSEARKQAIRDGMARKKKS